MKKILIFLLMCLVGACTIINPPSVEITGEVSQLVDAAIQDLAARTGVSESAIVVVRVDRKTWSDSSMGCPEPGGFYAQVRTPGYRIVLEADGQRYAYHAPEGGQAALYCDADKP